MTSPKTIKNLLTGYPAVIVLLILHWGLAVTSVREKSTTCDEIVHLTGGYSYWINNDYRINPENGSLPQRWAAIPLLFGDYRFPSMDQHNWRVSLEWEFSREFFYDLGNDLDKMLFSGRSMIALLSVALGFIVYSWSRRLFGATGGIISLIVYTFSPTILAHGRLITSDLAAALFFTAAVGCFWAVLHRISLLTLLASCLATSGLLLSKMSGVLVIPMYLGMLGIQMLGKRPLVVEIGERREIEKKRWRVLIFLGVICIHAAAVVLLIWAAYGFRYAAMANFVPGTDKLIIPWNVLLRDAGFVGSFIEFARNHHLLPEGYLYGFIHAYKFSMRRVAFLNGEIATRGWKVFFPYCLLVKTPLPIFALLLLSLLGAIRKWFSSGKEVIASLWRRLGAGFYCTAPLWVLLIVYWAFAINTHLNIGHRHILPTYPAMFILCGAAGAWLERDLRSVRGMVPSAVIVALLWLAIESLWIYPHYLAYFNQAAGGPKNGYKHLVDSSLDWGQDLPGLKRWLDRGGYSQQGAPPVYLSYFGNGRAAYYGINVKLLPCWTAQTRKVALFPLEPGVYCISASMLQSLYIRPIGPWAKLYEEDYQGLLRLVNKLWTLTPAQRDELRRAYVGNWDWGLQLFSELRLARLCAYLRRRKPDDHVGYSILIYRLGRAELVRALFGPPVELAPDVPDTIKRKLRREEIPRLPAEKSPS